MPSKYISINDAAEISGKSPQTIRRLIKSKKVGCKKIKTPQGFNYEVDREELLAYYQVEDRQVSAHSEAPVASPKLQSVSSEEEHAQDLGSDRMKALMAERDHKILVEYAPVKEFNNTLQILLRQHSKEKENLFKLVEAFQNKVVTLETKLKTQDDNKKWFKFW